MRPATLGIKASVVVGTLALAALLTVSLVAPPDEHAVTADAEAVLLPGREGSTLPSGKVTADEALTRAHLSGPAPQWVYGVWRDTPIIVIKAQTRSVDDPWAVPAPDDRRASYLAFSAKSTFHGCGVDVLSRNEDPDSSERAFDGKVIDVCHRWVWDLYAGGAPVGDEAAVFIPPLDRVRIHMSPMSEDAPIVASAMVQQPCLSGAGPDRVAPFGREIHSPCAAREAAT